MNRKIKSFSNYLSTIVSDEHLESMATSSGFMKRRSTISPKGFLDTVFFCNQNNSPSLSEYCIDLSQHGASVSKQAIDKRFNESTKAMFTNLLGEVMSHQLSGKAKKTASKKWFTDIQIMDSSEFAVSKRAAGTFPGYGGEGREALVQIQFEYQLLGGKVTTLSVGSALDSDSIEGMKNLDQIPAKTLLLRDLGYCSPKAFKELSKRDLYFISRAKSQWNFYTLHNGECHLLTTADIIGKLNQAQGKYIDLDVFVGEQVRTPVRLIANLLAEEQKKKRLKKKSANRKLGEDALESIGLNLFVTNVEREKCAASEIYELYTLRWQIELVFKTWKSVMQVHKIHGMNPIRLECIILIKLLWVMLNWSIVRYLRNLTGLDLSYHKVHRTILSRSKRISSIIMKSSELFTEWLIDLCGISERHHVKEYKKGSKSIPIILSQATSH
ncbi:MAG: IS4 family transposase [Flammeovirgaceae bacterium]|nr:IS4 family transposase [Flammeovirgaceae bacterium]